ncbi:DsbE family thiol:disulfide interchange protein [Thalassotalea piscium]|uniref:Cytochrome c biogenesis protein CcmG/thiol:disulfide interchange protein DsbE n=1 Tax=Thalassotalea piscium TaxID=1230533 RepID=A0A7X0TS63_9GAMM|nr:DsbE family thiol:disulfide interchange protein [Thalassotalea piscium]MBB6541740.1 cytochrome c biogenesis protein CcmG/thiol:disulfide interchange protein DsbE [Thalassotalea piscium]
MNKLIRLIPLILFIALGAVLYRGLSLNPQELPSALIDKKMPSFELTQLLNPEVTLTEQDLKGQIVLLNVWGTWCVYCKYEHPYLVDIAKGGRVSLYGLNYKDDRADATQWLSDYENPYIFSIFDDLGKLGIELGVTAAPETFVIDQAGVIRMKHVGPIDAKVWKDKFLPLIEILEKENQGIS